MVSEPIFLVGAERSGTTLLRLMLDHHPDIACHCEFEFAVDRVSPDGDWPPVDEYCDWLETTRVFRLSGFAIDRRLSYPELVNSFLVQKRSRDEKPVVGATVHRHFDRLLRIWPDARFLHIFRDGRDVARSVVRMGWAGNVWTAADRWIEAERTWDRVVAAISSDRYTQVRYEELLTKPEGILRDLCAFIPVPYDPAMLDYPAHSRYGPPDPSLAYQWRTRMRNRDIQLAEAPIGATLVARGYELSGLPPINVTPSLERRLRFQSRLAVAQFRMKRYGPSLWLCDAIARRCGPRAWRKRLALRLDDIDNRHLK